MNNFKKPLLRNFCSLRCWLLHTGKQTQREERQVASCLYRMSPARPQSQFPRSWVCHRFIYIPRIGPHIFLQEKADRSWEYINRSQAHEFGNRDCGRTIPFLGIFVSYFRYCVFAVCLLTCSSMDTSSKTRNDTD